MDGMTMSSIWFLAPVLVALYLLSSVKIW